MKQHQNLLWGAAALLLLSGCIDDKYDLANINTESEFKVKDLVLPVNLQPVVLSDIIKVDSEDKLTEVTVGNHKFYAVQQYGEFSSDGIDISKFTADPGTLEDKTAFFSLDPSTSMNARRKADANGYTETYLLTGPVTEDISYTNEQPIDGSLRSLKKVNFDNLVFRVDISTKGLSSTIQSELQEVEMQLPAGLVVTRIHAGGVDYDLDAYQSDGTLTLGTIKLQNADGANQVSIEIETNGIDLTAYTPNPYKYDPVSDSGSFELNSVFNIDDCKLKLTSTIDELLGIRELSYNVHYQLTNLNATSIIGEIAYDLEGTGLNIDPISLENMPSFLEDPNTNLILSNPQIYLQLMNPIGQYGLNYQSGIKIIAKRPNSSKEFDSDLVVVPPTEGTFNFVLAPNPNSEFLYIPEKPYDYREGIDRLNFKGLGEILSGQGLPETLEIELFDHKVPQREVTSPFLLGTSIEGMEGNYTFLAPLALREGSEIVKTIDGWYSEDLDDLTINLLSVTADATSTVPMAVRLTAYPIGVEVNGKRPQLAEPCTLELPAMAQGDRIELKFEGEIKGLDGINIEVWAASNDDEPLAPSQVITLENLKAKVTGNYTRKL